MGRHARAEEPPPPKNKPRYRFPIAIGAIALLAFTSMAIVAAVYPERAPQAATTPVQDPGVPGNPFPELSGIPNITSGPLPPPAVAAVAGAYQLTQDWVDGFIGAVQLSNSTNAPQSWQVTLVFPDNVKDLQARWISGGPGEATVSRAGQTVTFAGQQPLPAGTQIALHFQFTKAAGSPNPRECSVNGRPCSA